MTRYYKFLNEDRTSTFQSFQYPEVGEWLPAVEGDPLNCENGYHVFKRENAIDWIAPSLYLIEAESSVVDFDNKSATTGRIRLANQLDAWNEKTARLFATDCAALTLHMFESVFPNDARPRKAIETARLFANGAVSEQESAVARAAAWEVRGASAAWDAARDAARDALTKRFWQYAEGTAGDVWEIDKGERLQAALAKREESA